MFQDRQVVASGARGEFLQSFRILLQILGRRYSFIWATALILFAGTLLDKRFASPSGPAPTFSFLKNNWKVVTLFLISYYALSLYKQNFYFNVVYFLVGEIFFLLIFGAPHLKRCSPSRTPGFDGPR